MKQLSDVVVDRLRAGMQTPDLTGTRYTILRLLARGGMGSVWLVEDTLLHRAVALKVLDAIPTAEDLPARLMLEARVLATLEHPGIVPVHDAGTLLDGRAFYCMQYVEGRTLAQHIANLTLNDKRRLLQRIAEPLDFAHARGYVHRDLKPENIMIGAFGEVLIMDWGLAKAGPVDPHNPPFQIDSAPTVDCPRDTRPGSVLGTPGYMSPEQAHGQTRIDHRSDIYSLGAILCFLLNESPATNPPATSETIPRPLRAISAKALDSDPNARYQSAGDLAADVVRYLNGAPVTAYPESLLERASRLLTRHQTAVVLIAAYLLMRVLFILFARH